MAKGKTPRKPAGSRKVPTVASYGNGNGGAGDRGIDFEEIESEERDREYSPPSYEIVTYPADFTLAVLVDKWRKGDIVIPKFQRRFVWTLPQSSRLIESFLLGLPVPPIFLYAKTDGSLLVVDGQQRLKTITYFFEGSFGEEERGARSVFRLTGLSDDSPYYNKTYNDLENSDDASFKRLNDAVLRSFIVKQLNPKDDTSIIHIFERLNTGGTTLTGQEIRNCVYHGRFLDLLLDLNKLDEWRDILGKKSEDRRQRDIELILRFFALLYNARKYDKPMKEFLNHFMNDNNNPSTNKLKEYERIFVETVGNVRKVLGERPFHIRAGLNTAVFDSVFVAFASHTGRSLSSVRSRYKRMVKSKQFSDCVTAGTTDVEVVQKRLALAKKTLFDR